MPSKYYFYHSHGRWLVGYDDEQGCFWEYAARRGSETDTASANWADALTRKLNRDEE